MVQPNVENGLPSGANLLNTARQVLLSNILPLLEGDAKRDALMVANAMGIAMREMSQDPLAGEREVLAMQQLLDVNDSLYPKPERVVKAELVKMIRKGANSKAEQRAWLHHLRLATRRQLEVSNPKVLLG